ncbi:unnamed protein product, partial [Pylaiella littoralis]
MLLAFRQSSPARVMEGVQHSLPTMRRRTYCLALMDIAPQRGSRRNCCSSSSSSSSSIGFVFGVHNVNIGSPSTPYYRQHHQQQRQLRHTRPLSSLPRARPRNCPN